MTKQLPVRYLLTVPIKLCGYSLLFATADINYKGLNNYALTFDPGSTETTVNIFIIATNETLFEEDEEFTVNLSFPGEPIPRVELEPGNATITIFEINEESTT